MGSACSMDSVAAANAIQPTTAHADPSTDVVIEDSESICIASHVPVPSSVVCQPTDTTTPLDDEHNAGALLPLTREWTASNVTASAHDNVSYNSNGIGGEDDGRADGGAHHSGGGGGRDFMSTSGGEMPSFISQRSQSIVPLPRFHAERLAGAATATTPAAAAASSSQSSVREAVSNPIFRMQETSHADASDGSTTLTLGTAVVDGGTLQSVTATAKTTTKRSERFASVTLVGSIGSIEGGAGKHQQGPPRTMSPSFGGSLDHSRRSEASGVALDGTNSSGSELGGGGSILNDPSLNLQMSCSATSVLTATEALRILDELDFERQRADILRQLKK